MNVRRVTNIIVAKEIMERAFGADFVLHYEKEINTLFSTHPLDLCELSTYSLVNYGEISLNGGTMLLLASTMAGELSMGIDDKKKYIDMYKCIVSALPAEYTELVVTPENDDKCKVLRLVLNGESDGNTIIADGLDFGWIEMDASIYTLMFIPSHIVTELPPYVMLAIRFLQAVALYYLDEAKSKLKVRLKSFYENGACNLEMTLSSVYTGAYGELHNEFVANVWGTACALRDGFPFVEFSNLKYLLGDFSSLADILFAECLQPKICHRYRAII